MGTFEVWLLSLGTIQVSLVRTAQAPPPPRGGVIISWQSLRDCVHWLVTGICRFGHNLLLFGTVEKTGSICEFYACSLYLREVLALLGNSFFYLPVLSGQLGG